MIRAFSASVLALSLLLPLAAKPAAAQNLGLNLPPEGTTIINLSATEKRTMPQDLLIASLRIEVTDKNDPSVVQKKINESMKKALELAKKNPAFKVSTGSYSVYRNTVVIKTAKTGDTTTEEVWQGSQTIDIETKDSTALLETVGKIQGFGFAMNNLSYTLSPEIVDKVKDELMIAALKKLTAKADVIAKTLGKSKADLVDVSVDEGGAVQPMYKAMRMEASVAMDSAMPAPVAEAGETDVSLTVTARALIKP